MPALLIVYAIIHFAPLIALGSVLQENLGLHGAIAFLICAGIWFLLVMAHITFPKIYSGFFGCVIAGMVLFPGLINRGDPLTSILMAGLFGIIAYGACLFVAKEVFDTPS